MRASTLVGTGTGPGGIMDTVYSVVVSDAVVDSGMKGLERAVIRCGLRTYYTMFFLGPEVPPSEFVEIRQP